MFIGRYDQEITFCTKVKTNDGYGGPIINYVDEIVTFARIEQLKQSKSLIEVQQQLPTAFRVGIHFESFNPTLDYVIKWEDEYYNILNTPTRVDRTRNVKEWIFDIGKA